MKDTLLIGDFLFVNKMAYGYSRYSCPFAPLPDLGPDPRLSEPERGDVVVFRHPVNGSDFIKRLIGLPGDRIQMQGRRALHQRRGSAAGARRASSTKSSNRRARWATCRAARTARWARAAICTASRFIETLPERPSRTMS